MSRTATDRLQDKGADADAASLGHLAARSRKGEGGDDVPAPGNDIIGIHDGCVAFDG